MDILLFFLILAMIVIMIKVLNKKSNKKESGNIAEVKNIFNPFYLKPKTMNGSEQAFYINLKKQIGEFYLILSKVRIEDFIGVKHGGLTKPERFGLRNKIKSRHVDFLICDLKTSRPLIAIEIDGASHNSYKGIKRDEMLDKIYKDINLEYVHIRVGSNFKEKVEKIKEILNNKIL
jgi:very-short-patch-repair endonuclease